MLRFDHVIRDPVHRDIPLTTEELRVLDTAEIQRLRSVRQLGAAHLVYPGAQHTRFEHSVGTAHLALRMAESANGVRDTRGASFGGYDPQELRVIRIAALVHDCTHLPFGHNIEDQVGEAFAASMKSRTMPLSVGPICRLASMSRSVLIPMASSSSGRATPRGIPAR